MEEYIVQYDCTDLETGTEYDYHGRILGDLIRCKDCKYQDKGENESESWNMCRMHNISTYDEAFCSWGRKREEK